MPATFKPELKNAARQDGTFAVRIRITKFREHAYYNTGKYITKTQWNPKPSPRLSNWIIKHLDADQYNNALKNIISGLEKVSDAYPAATAAEIKQLYLDAVSPKPTPKKQTGFLDFMQEYIERCRVFNEGTALTYGSIANQLKEFLAGKAETDQEVLSPAIITAYIQDLKKKGHSAITIRNRISFLNTVYTKGLKEGRVLQLGDPFEGFKKPVPEKKKVRPTADQIKALLSYQPKSKLQARSRQAALMQYLCHGARISEMLTLEWDKHVFPDRIEFLPRKRATKLKVIPRTPLLNWLLEQMPRKSPFVLPYFTAKDLKLKPRKLRDRISACTLSINRGLKLISEQLKFGIAFSSHMMRHSFADAVISETSDMRMVQELLGQKSIVSTENYVNSLKQSAVKEVSGKVYGSLPIPKAGKQ